MPPEDALVTGVGVISPIGTGRDRFWDSLCAGRSGVGPIRRFDPAALPVRIAAEISDFDPKTYVRPRKSLKLMARDSQLGVAASVLACEDAGLAPGEVAPERFGVILGADRIAGSLEDSESLYRPCMPDGRFEFNRWGSDGISGGFPLSFLKVLPNMIAAHVSIAHDARGPSNTIHQAEQSSLAAVTEAAAVIQRGAADVMIAGGASSQLSPYDWVRHCLAGGLSTSGGDPAVVLRPFDAGRSGQVRGEGAATFILESRSHAEARGARILARVLGWASTCQPKNGGSTQRVALERVISRALENAGVKPADVGHVNAHGLSGVVEDRVEAQAIHACVPGVPVTAPKSYFGNLGAAGGAVEMAASVLSLSDGRVPATLNYRQPDPKCPVAVIAEAPQPARAQTALLVNWTWIGQAVAVVLGGAD
jgi:3-oxoacyl-[acyl-carrier-protein] synthase II